jgi:hypothetical protein
MSRLLTLVKLVIAIVAVGLLIHLSDANDSAWAAAGRETDRQTVPTRTPTPKPVTPTTAPTRTNTPAPPRATHTPKPLPSVTRTPTLTPTTTAPAQSDPAPPTLPRAGGITGVLAAGAVLTVSGCLVFLAGIRSRRSGGSDSG